MFLVNCFQVFPSIAAAHLHTTATLSRKQAGRYRTTKAKNFPLTYEMAQGPWQIQVTKSWNSINTSNLEDGLRKSESATEDFFIRRFMHGTWHELFASDVVIKRRANIIIIAGVVLRRIYARKYYFLIGYTEEILSYILKCPVKVEIQTIADHKEIVFKYI